MQSHRRTPSPPSRDPNRPALPGLIGAICLALGAQAVAQAPAPQAPPAPAPQTPQNPPADATLTRDRGSVNLSREDQLFVEKAAQSGLAEVTFGRLAVERSGFPQVRAYGNAMVNDHGRLNEELKRIASNRGLLLSTSLDVALQRDADRMSQLKGTDFDDAFMMHMIESHRRAVSEFEAAANNSRDEELKAFAARSLPQLQQHLQLAMNTLAELRRNQQQGGNPPSR